MIRSLGRVVHADAGSVIVDLPGWPGHRPGQFAMLALDAEGLSSDPLLPRPMAVFRADGERVEFRHKVVGRGTARLAGLPAGAPLAVVGPLGNGFPERDEPLVLIGGGTGIASLYEVAAAAPTARVLLGGRGRDDILGLADFEKLDATLEIATEDGSLGQRGLVTELFTPEAGTAVFACGPTPMMRAVHELASAAGVTCFVSLENQMACGFGVCLGCVVPSDSGFAYVCTDGPVFDSRTVHWDGLP